MTLLEICIDDAAGLAAAIAGGADRVEVCAALELGGLTPAPGLMALAAGAGIPARAMIRPRPGDFVFDAGDVDAMLGDIAAARAAGLEGVVLGASHADGRLDLETLGVLCAAATGLKRTLHRAIDLAPDMAAAVDAAIALGFDTILSSGQARTAPEGMAQLALAHRRARGRLTVMAGAGITERTAPALLARLPLGAVHGSCSEPASPSGPAARHLGFASPARRTTSAAKVAALKAAIRQIV